MTSITLQLVEKQVAYAKLLADTLAASTTQPPTVAPDARLSAAATAQATPVAPDALIAAATSEAATPVTPDAPLRAAPTSGASPVTPDAPLSAAPTSEATPVTPDAPLSAAPTGEATPVTPDAPPVAEAERVIPPPIETTTGEAGRPVIASSDTHAVAPPVEAVVELISIDDAGSPAVLQTQQAAAESWLDTRILAMEQDETLSKILPAPIASTPHAGPRLSIPAQPTSKAKQIPVSSANAAAKKPKAPAVSSDRKPLKRGPAKKK